MEPAVIGGAFDREALFHRLERGAMETARGMKVGMVLVAGLFAVGAVFFAASSAWGGAAMCIAFVAAIAWIGVRAAKRTAPERMLPVIAALRDAPHTITIVRHYQTSDTRRMFVTDWIAVHTATHRLLVKAKQDWQPLAAQLAELCPHAKHLDR